MKTEFKTTLQVKPCYLNELGNMYGVSAYVMNSWLKPIKKELGERNSKLFTVKQVAIIFENLGVPGMEYHLN